MKVLIATDNSEFSRAVVEKVCEIIPRDRPAHVKIVSVFEPPTPVATEPFAMPAGYYQSLLESARLHAEDAVGSARGLIEGNCPAPQLEVSTECSMGRPAQFIVEAARVWGADMIAVGSHGRGFWGKLTLGSVSDAVVHHAPCSVLVVRGGGAESRLQEG